MGLRTCLRGVRERGGWVAGICLSEGAGWQVYQGEICPLTPKHLPSVFRCISTLYRDPSWSQKALQGPIKYASERVCSSKIGMLSPKQFEYYSREKRAWESRGHSMSFTDLWGLIIEYFLNQEENPAKLSDQQETVSQGQNPYPIYASINVHKNISGDDFAGARM